MYILSRKPVPNLGKMIDFELDQDRLARRLVITVTNPQEISIASPVGRQLADAKPGDVFKVTVKGEEGYLFGKVLEVADSLSPEMVQ